jgi:hypothetical protein
VLDAAPATASPKPYQYLQENDILSGGIHESIFESKYAQDIEEEESEVQLETNGGIEICSSSKSSSDSNKLRKSITNSNIADQMVMEVGTTEEADPEEESDGEMLEVEMGETTYPTIITVVDSITEETKINLANESMHNIRLSTPDDTEELAIAN